MDDDIFDTPTDTAPPLPERARAIPRAQPRSATAGVALPADSFRQSEAYLAGRIARAVARGHRTQ